MITLHSNKLLYNFIAFPNENEAVYVKALYEIAK